MGDATDPAGAMAACTFEAWVALTPLTAILATTDVASLAGKTQRAPAATSNSFFIRHCGAVAGTCAAELATLRQIRPQTESGLAHLLVSAWTSLASNIAELSAKTRIAVAMTGGASAVIAAPGAAEGVPAAVDVGASQ